MGERRRRGPLGAHVQRRPQPTARHHGTIVFRDNRDGLARNCRQCTRHRPDLQRRGHGRARHADRFLPRRLRRPPRHPGRPVAERPLRQLHRGPRVSRAGTGGFVRRLGIGRRRRPVLLPLGLRRQDVRFQRGGDQGVGVGGEIPRPVDRQRRHGQDDQRLARRPGGCADGGPPSVREGTGRIREPRAGRVREPRGRPRLHRLRRRLHDRPRHEHRRSGIQARLVVQPGQHVQPDPAGPGDLFSRFPRRSVHTPDRWQSDRRRRRRRGGAGE